jgi:hypothetical protein
MTKPSVAGTVLLLAALSVAVAGGGATYRTPEEVFEAAKKAIAREDWKGFCATLTDDSRDMLAGGLAMMPLMAKGFAKFAGEEKEKEILAKLKPLTEVLNKHGLTEETLNKMKDEKPAGLDPEAIRKGLKRLVSPIKDRCAFVAEMAAALKKMGGKKDQGAPLPKDAELKDLKIEGDKAKGVVVSKADDKEKRDPIEFRKVGGGWKIELPIQIGKGLKKGPPPGP